MARVTNAARERQAAAAEAERCARALARDFGDYQPVRETWTRQTQRAAVFPSYGAIATALLRWRKPDGRMVSWVDGMDGDTLMAPAWKLRRAAQAGG